MTSYAVTVTGTGGATLTQGQVVTGAAVRDIVIANNIAKVTYEAKTPDVQKGSHTLYRKRNGAYVKAVSDDYGDWAYYAISIGVVADRAVVITATQETVEVAFEWTTFDLSSYSGGGVGYRDRDNALNYPQSSSTAKKFTSTKLIKVIRMDSGREGYFIGWHSDPRIGPLGEDIPSLNNETAYGERELGTGGGSRVFFTSNNVQCLHPDFGDDARGWVAAGFTGATNRPCWGGIDDANYSPYTAAAFIALQGAGFPKEQSTGPWWAADLHYLNASTVPFCRYVTLVERFELGSWQFGHSAYGATVVHFVNEAHDASGVPYRYQVFLGAFEYVSENLALEPTENLKHRVGRRAPSTFLSSGQAEDLAAHTTATTIRDAMLDAAEDLTPTSLSGYKFRRHREDIPIREFAEQNPGAALRLISIRDTFDFDEPRISDLQQEEVWTTFEVVVAYPSTGKALFGPKQELSMQTVMEQDLHQLRHAIGANGYATLDVSTGGAATVTEDRPSVEPGTPCSFVVLNLRTRYLRAMP